MRNLCHFHAVRFPDTLFKYLKLFSENNNKSLSFYQLLNYFLKKMMSKKKCKLLLRPVFFIDIDITLYKQPTNQGCWRANFMRSLAWSRVNKLPGLLQWYIFVILPKRCHACLSYYLMEKNPKKDHLASMWQKKGGENQHFESGGLSVISCIPPGSSPSSPTEKKPWCLGVEKTISIHLQRPMRSSEFFSNTLPTIVSEGPVWDPFVWFESGKKTFSQVFFPTTNSLHLKMGVFPLEKEILIGNHHV